MGRAFVVTREFFTPKSWSDHDYILRPGPERKGGGPACGTALLVETQAVQEGSTAALTAS